MELVKVNNNGKLITELKVVCGVYGKKHKNVLRDIRNIIGDLPSLTDEFIPTTYIDAKGETRSTYYLTEKGFYMLSASFRGSKAREFQSKFFDAFKALKDENKMLRSACTELFNGCNSELVEIMSTSEIIKHIKALKDENKTLLSNQYITKHTYCISDITQKFKKITPYTAQLFLIDRGYLTVRKNGVFPNEFYDKNNTIVSVLDENREQYYPRYTLKGTRMVEDVLLEEGYELKGID